uniref:Uncharacterized protein n=1 Tax=Photinus pyralis TaxID=7054 RepID=A0A1Y1JVZ1_PHOPY
MENPISFSTLEGITIGERRKNLFLQLNLLNKDSAMDFRMLNPQTPLEEKFKLDTLIHFGAVPQLIEMLKCENPVIIKRILNIPACVEAISNYSDQELLSLLSEVSFNTKQKILNRLPPFLSNQETFEALLNTYGFYLSSKLLPICDSKVILTSIKENRWIPTARQLKVVIQRHPGIVEEIFKLLLAIEKSKGHYNKLLTLIAESNPDLVTKLHETEISHRMGRRTTRHFVKSNKGAVTREPSVYYKFLHHKEIAKAIGASFPDMLSRLLPRTVETFADSLPELLKVCRNSEVLLETFRKKYGRELWECDDMMTREVLQLLTVEQRARLSKPEDMTEDEWMCYAPIGKSVPYLKKRISLTSDIEARAQLMELLVETCKVNNSKEALAQMCQHVVKYHRNDHMTVRLAFLRRIRTSYGLQNLDDTHWGPVYELMQLFALNNETFFHLQEFLEPYIRFRLRMNLPIRDQLTLLVKAQTYQFNICRDTPSFEKRCLLEFGEIIPSTIKDEFNVTYCYNQFLNALVNWNKRHSRDPISLYSYQDALEHVNATLIGSKSRTYSIDGITKYCIQSRQNTEERNKMLALYLAPSNKFLELNVLKWLCCNEPKTLVDSIGDVMANLLPMYQLTRSQRFWQLFRSYSHLQLPEKIADLLQSHKNSTTDYVMQNATTGLSYLLSPHCYANLVDTHIPKTDGERTESKLWKHLGRCIKNSPPAPPILNCLPSFCKSNGRLVQNSLQSIAGNLNEPKLPPLFADLGKCTTSSQKQAVQLTLRTLDKPHAFQILSATMEIAKTATFHSFILKTCSKFFAQNPDDDSWNLLRMVIEKVDLNDRQVRKVLLLKKIPAAYFSAYFTLVWGVLDGRDVGNMEKLLDLVTRDNIGSLPGEFCQGIVTNYLWKNEEENFQASVHSFTCKYLLYCDADIVGVFPILKEYLAKAWSDCDINSRGRASVANFVTQFCLEFLTDSSTNFKALDTFVEQWNGSFKPHDAFDEYLHLELTRIYVKKLPLDEIAARIGKLCNALVESYGLMAVAPFCDKLVGVFNYFVKNTEFLEENRYKVFEALYKTTRTIACSALVILLMSQYPATLKETLEQYKAIIMNLEACDDTVIQCFLHNHFTAISTQ